MAGEPTAGAPERPSAIPGTRLLTHVPGGPAPDVRGVRDVRPRDLRLREARAPEGRTPAGLARFNTAPRDAAETALLACCGSRRWGRRIAAHRPYPTLDALLAAADEAGYDLSAADLAEALADEAPPVLPPGTPAAARTALEAAHAAYRGRFGHAFVICLDGYRREEHVDQVLSGIRCRLNHEPDEERAVSADELRRLVRARLSRLVMDSGHPDSPFVLV
ncbi:2-oxo-4-hydroxy-4-carboxy-5-ureidoimidazoline decarboxylase [Streptomyces sp. NRRL S-118]|uniref:2-oxo-4-hydroxy-4-carboxy-5-ureidoimidazoline decarboxylase n=1 Tax=Streptomyces sp. NRRL S-118 TaxID=1463881 RepID=UPI00099CF255|nr:2-oxo-4-hydroxy-4-carboxy-5-ureidoimidazoline decarboxylase [Streptomyces sp. NRRL S-118]